VNPVGLVTSGCAGFLLGIAALALRYPDHSPLGVVAILAMGMPTAAFMLLWVTFKL
jgi:hypothetical protein